MLPGGFAIALFQRLLLPKLLLGLSIDFWRNFCDAALLGKLLDFLSGSRSYEEWNFL